MLMEKVSEPKNILIPSMVVGFFFHGDEIYLPYGIECWFKSHL